MVEEREMALGVSQMTVQAAPVVQAVQVATLDQLLPQETAERPMMARMAVMTLNRILESRRLGGFWSSYRKK